MGIHGIHMLTADEALNVQLGALGFDEVDFTEHLTEGAALTSTYWSVDNDLYDSGGGTGITITDEQDLNLKAFFAGELLDSLQVLTPLANRIMTDNQNQWTNHNLTTFSDAGSWLRTDANSIGLYCKLATQYAPMSPGVSYTMVVKTNGQTWNGPGWSFQDYDGNELFQVTSDPGTSGQTSTFTAPAGTSGGFRIASLGDCDVFYWDNFELTRNSATSVSDGLTFKVGGTGDTEDNDLSAEKSSAPANNDIFIVTNIHEEIMPNEPDRIFSGGTPTWADVDLATGGGSYDESGDLSLVAGGSGAGDYCTLPVASAPMTVGVTYRLYYDLAGLTGTWYLKDFTGTDTYGTISATATQAYVEFECETGGGFRLVAVSNSAAGNFDNFSLSLPPSVAYVGNATASYGWSAAQRSILEQSYSDRASAGLNGKGKNSKEYKLTYTIIEGLAPDGDFALTLEGFGGDTELIGARYDREFTYPSNWADVDLSAYDEDTDLTITSDAAGQYCTLPVANAPMTAGKYYRVTFDVANLTETFYIQDFTGAQTFCTISADGTSQTVYFKVETGITGGFRLVAVATVSSMDFDNVSLKEVDKRGSVINTAITLPHSSGAQTVYFKSNHNADVAPFRIVATTTTGTQGALGIDTLTLFRCCDNDKNPDGVSWYKVKAFQGTATFSATAINGDDLSSDTLAEHQTIEGAWSRIVGTAGILLAYRVPYRSTDV